MKVFNFFFTYIIFFQNIYIASASVCLKSSNEILQHQEMLLKNYIQKEFPDALISSCETLKWANSYMVPCLSISFKYQKSVDVYFDLNPLRKEKSYLQKIVGHQIVHTANAQEAKYMDILPFLKKIYSPLSLEDAFIKENAHLDQEFLDFVMEVLVPELGNKILLSADGVSPRKIKKIKHRYAIISDPKIEGWGSLEFVFIKDITSPVIGDHSLIHRLFYLPSSFTTKQLRDVISQNLKDHPLALSRLEKLYFMEVNHQVASKGQLYGIARKILLFTKEDGSQPFPRNISSREKTGRRVFDSKTKKDLYEHKLYNLFTNLDALDKAEVLSILPEVVAKNYLKE